MSRKHTDMPQEFVVDDVFSFRDGRTVFTGRLLGDSSYLKTCRADVMIEGVVKFTVLLEEEMLPLNREDRSIRSLSTRDQVAIHPGRISGGGIILRLHEGVLPERGKGDV